jgi:hypothetical protein
MIRIRVSRDGRLPVIGVGVHELLASPPGGRGERCEVRGGGSKRPREPSLVESLQASLAYRIFFLALCFVAAGSRLIGAHLLTGVAASGSGGLVDPSSRRASEHQNERDDQKTKQTTCLRDLDLLGSGTSEDTSATAAGTRPDYGRHQQSV